MSGFWCSGEDPIVDSEPEFEPQYNDGRAAVRFHDRCYGIWDAERYSQAT